MADQAPKYFKQLVRFSDSEVPQHVRNRILWMPDAGPRLISLLHHTVARTGRTAAHAIELLGDLGDPQAVDPLLEFLQVEDGDLHYYAHEALVVLGPAAIAPLLRTIWDRLADVAPILAECAAHCHRDDVRQVLCRVLELNPELGADCAKLYGDATMTQELLTALMQLDETRPSHAVRITALAIRRTIQSFGVELGPLASRKVEKLLR